jgi:hypothetical protein
MVDDVMETDSNIVFAGLAILVGIGGLLVGGGFFGTLWKAVTYIFDRKKDDDE